MKKSTNIRTEGIENHYYQWRLEHPEAAPWDKVINYAINGDEFGDELTIHKWVKVTKAHRNTVLKWLPLIRDYVNNSSILNERTANAIVASNITKQKNKG